MYNSLIFIPAKSRYPVEAALYFEWSMGDDAQNLRAAGIEGEHYDMVDGEIVLRMDNLADTWRSGGAIDVRSFKYRQTIAGVYEFHEQRKEYATIMDYYLYSPYIEEVEEVWTEMHDYVNEQYVKFIIGTRSLNDFQLFAGEVEKMGSAKAFAALNKWYAEAYG
jgi:hypothetical protein